MKSLLLLVFVTLSLASTTQNCCGGKVGCVCGVNIDDNLKSVAKLGADKILAASPGHLNYVDVLQVKKQVVAGIIYTVILKFQNEDKQTVYYTAQIYDEFGSIHLQHYALVSEDYVNKQLGTLTTTPTKGCCYEVGYGNRMSKNYNTFRDVDQSACAVGKRIGGETKFETSDCDTLKLKLGVSNGNQAPLKGCCYSVGYGSFMKKIYGDFQLSSQEDCKAEQRLGGATIYDKRDCDTLQSDLGIEKHKAPTGTDGKENAVLTGGWKEIDPSSADVVTAGAVGADYIKGRINTVLSNCKVKSCMGQVVAGMNYKIVLQCSAMGVETKQFAVQVYRPPTGPMKVTEFHELGDMVAVSAKVPFTTCPGKDGTVTMSDVEATSWPPTKGTADTISATGTGTKTVTGGKWTLTATWKGYKILTDDGMVCDATKCPAAAGTPFTAKIAIKVPAVEPSGDYEVITSASDQDGADLFCIVAKFSQ